MMWNHCREESDSKSQGARAAAVRTFIPLLRRIVSSSESSFALFVCVLALTFAYRIHLTIGLFTNPVKPFDFNPAHHPVWFMLAYLPYDLALVLACFLLSWLLSRMKFGTRQSRIFSTLKISGFVFLHIAIITLLLVHEIHRLFCDPGGVFRRFAYGNHKTC
jgi:hypothetical protein